MRTGKNRIIIETICILLIDKTDEVKGRPSLKNYEPGKREYYDDTRTA